MFHSLLSIKKPTAIYVDLVSAYNFNSNADDQKGGNDGTLAGGPSLSAGKIGNGYTYTGTEYIQMGNVLSFEYTDPFSISAWIKTNNTGGQSTIVSKSNSSSPFNGYLLIMSEGGSNIGSIGFYLVGTFPDLVGRFTTNAFNDGNWHSVHATYDGSGNRSGINIYIDGALEAMTDAYNATVSSTIVNSVNFQVGARDGGNQTFQGDIDIVKVWSRELSAGDILEDYNTGIGREYPY